MNVFQLFETNVNQMFHKGYFSSQTFVTEIYIEIKEGPQIGKEQWEFRFCQEA